MNSDYKVIYRRIRGRIIPIKIKGQSQDVLLTKKTALGAAQAATGAGVAAYSGNKAYHFLRASADAENLARGAKIAKKKAASLMQISKGFHMSRNVALLGGAVVGGALIAKGFQNIFRDNKHLKKKEAVGGQVAKFAGGFAVASAIGALAYRRRVNPIESIHKAVAYARSRNALDMLFKGK